MKEDTKVLSCMLLWISTTIVAAACIKWSTQEDPAMGFVLILSAVALLVIGALFFLVMVAMVLTPEPTIMDYMLGNVKKKGE